MKRFKIKPIQSIRDAMDFDDLFYEISHDWHRKAEALQIRRWHKLKAQEHNLIHKGGLS